MTNLRVQYDVANTHWGWLVIQREVEGSGPWGAWQHYVEAPTFEVAQRIVEALRKEDS